MDLPGTCREKASVMVICAAPARGGRSDSKILSKAVAEVGILVRTVFRDNSGFLSTELWSNLIDMGEMQEVFQSDRLDLPLSRPKVAFWFLEGFRIPHSRVIWRKLSRDNFLETATWCEIGVLCRSCSILPRDARLPDVRFCQNDLVLRARR